MSRSRVARVATPRDGFSSSPKAKTKIVGIGASAGGLEAFSALLQNLPSKSSAAYVLVQHLDPTHRSLLSELLGKVTPLPVREIEDRAHVEPDHIYVIPPNSELTIENGCLYLSPRRKAQGAARSIDHFFRSLARDQKENAIAVILSGAGSDGSDGLKAIKQAGGITFAQDETAKYDSMPRAAVATGCVDFVLPPPGIAAEIARIVEQPERTKRRAAANAKNRAGKVGGRAPQYGSPAEFALEWPSAPRDLNLRKIFTLLKTKTGLDFSYYRINTIRRRLTRRCTVTKARSLEQYVRILRENPSEIDALYQDLLINVTSFFRNPKVFEFLKRKVFPRLVKAGNKDSLRVWVPGCSTGQEAYSIAMAYLEYAQEAGVPLALQVFASDVNPSVLNVARAGRYAAAQLEGVSPARIERFFTPEGDAYRVTKAVRDLVIFAQQNLLSDPPFTRVDLITCRNLLIYLEPALQQRIIPTFHYALRAHGCLALGTSESVGQFTTLFEPLDKANKIYLKKPAASWQKPERPLPTLSAKAEPPASAKLRAPEFSVLEAQKEADRITVAKYGPVAVLINEDEEVLQFRGETRRYLDLPTGKATFQLLRLVRDGLVLPLQRVLARAKKENRAVREKDVSFNGRSGKVSLEVIPLKNQAVRCFLILFDAAEARLPEPAPSPARKRGPARGSSDPQPVAELRQELADTKERLHNLQEQYETSVEELQASNEEVQSANEELQSVNEELETSNEELESSNEELTTLNEELAVRNGELQESERKLREQGQMLELAPVLARSPKDRVLFWTRGAERLYGYSKDEAIGQNSHLLLASEYGEPLERITKQVLTQGAWEGEVRQRCKSGKVLWVASQWVAHYDEQKKLRGILQTDTDITARKQAEESLRTSEEFNRAVLDSSPDAIVVLDLEGRIEYLSAGACRLLEVSDPKVHHHAFWSSLWEAEARKDVDQSLRAARAGKLGRFEGVCCTGSGVRKWWNVAVRPMLGANARPERILAVARDVTEEKREELEAKERAQLALLRAEISFAIALGRDRDETLQEVAARIAETLDGTTVRLWMVDAPSGELVLKGSAGRLRYGPFDRERLAPREAALGEILSRGQLWIAAGSELKNVLPAESVETGVLQAGAMIPCVMRNGAVGLIALFAPAMWSERTLAELQSSAEAVAQFIHRCGVEEDRERLLHETLAARAEFELLNEVGRVIAAELDQQRLAQAVIEAATKLTRAEFGAFIYNTLNAKSGTETLHAVAGPAADGLRESLAPRGTDVFPAGFEGGRTLRSIDLSSEAAPRSAAPAFGALARLPARSYLAVPVASRSGEIMGGLFFGHSNPGVFTEREERVVVSLASQAGVAMDNARLFDQLERKVVERTARLQETITELQAFSYTVSHDLRAPLRAMQSYAQVLQEDFGAQLDGTAQEYLTKIVNAGARLDRLIQDVLTYSRVSRAEVTLKRVELDRLVREIVDQYPMLQGKAAAVTIDGPLPEVMAEESATTQCFSNLLGNAVKFVPKECAPQIRIFAETFDHKVRVWVWDNGIGIAPEHHERIFKMFERVDPSKKFDGTGIGLAIVRRAMERMGGRVGVESQLGEGSRFWLEFQRP